MPTYKLTEEEYKKFCDNVKQQHPEDIIPPYDQITGQTLIQSFLWIKTPEGHVYWKNIYDRNTIPGIEEI